MEKIILLQVPEKTAAQIKRLAANKKIRTDIIVEADAELTLQQLTLGAWEAASEKKKELPQESLMLMCGLSEKHLDRLLFEMRQKGLKTDYKVVLTKTNEKWSLGRLYMELEMEKTSRKVLSEGI